MKRVRRNGGHLADQLVADLPDGHYFYILSSYSGERIEIEAWACTTNRGGSGTRLVTLPNREPITAIPLQNKFGWVCEPSVYETNNQENMNRVEKTVHWILFHDPRSMWLECGMGGVHQKVGELRYFSLSYIHGAPDGLEFPADDDHPRTLRPDLVKRLNELRMARLNE